MSQRNKIQIIITHLIPAKTIDFIHCFGTEINSHRHRVSSDVFPRPRISSPCPRDHNAVGDHNHNVTELSANQRPVLGASDQSEARMRCDVMMAREGVGVTPILSPDNYNLSRGLQMSPIMSTHILSNHRLTPHQEDSFHASGQYFR